MALKLCPPGERGHRHWFVYGRVGGRLVERSTGETDRTAAKRRLREFEAALQREGLEPGAGGSITYAEADARYRAYRNPAPEDLKRLDRVAAVLGRRRLRDITAAEIHEVANRLGAGTTPATRNREYLRPACCVLHHAANVGLCAYLRVPLFREPRPKTKALDETVAAALIEAAEPGPRRLLLRWLFLQGTRISDTLRVQWKDLDLDAGSVRVHVSKTDEDRTFPLHRDVLVELCAVPEAERQGRVFPWSSRHSLDWIKRLARDTGIHFTPHMARHSLGTWLNARGAGLRTIMEALGHANVRSSIRYQGADVEVVRQAADGIDLGGGGDASARRVRPAGAAPSRDQRLERA